MYVPRFTPLVPRMHSGASLGNDGTGDRVVDLLETIRYLQDLKKFATNAGSPSLALDYTETPGVTNI